MRKILERFILKVYLSYIETERILSGPLCAVMHTLGLLIFWDVRNIQIRPVLLSFYQKENSYLFSC